jgi:RHS repeat-associated protein
MSTMNYNSAGDLISLARSTGLTTTFTHDEIGRPLTETTTWPGGSSTYAFTYNKLGQPRTVTDPRVQNRVTGQWHQARTTWTYGNNTNPVQISIADIEPASGAFVPDPTRTLLAEYDLNDRVWRMTDPEQKLTSVEFDAVGNITKYFDALNRVTQTTYDAENRPTVVKMLGYVDPTNPGTSVDITLSNTSYDDLGRVDTVTDALGRVVRSSYVPAGVAGAGQLWKQTLLNFDLRAGGLVDVVLDEYDYYSNGQLEWLKTANGTVLTTYTYDSLNRLSTETLKNTVAGYPASRDRVTTYAYDGSTDRVASETRTDSVQTIQTRSVYDALGRPTQSIVENGASDLITVVGYDERGLPVTVTDPRNNVTTTSFDLLGRSWKVTNPTATVETFGAAPAVTATFGLTGYNTFGEQSHGQDALGHITTVAYDRNGRPTTTTFPSYIPPGASTPLTPSETNVYDGAGNLSQFLDRRNQVTDLTYDNFNRLAITRAPSAMPGGTRAETRVRYDSVGQPVWMQNPIRAITERTYDDLGRTRTATQVVRNGTPTPSRFTTTNDYNWRGDSILTIDATNTTVMSAVYSPAGNLLASTDALGYSTTADCDLRGQALKVTDPAGRYTKNVYDLAGRLVDTGRYAANNTRVIGELYGYDLVGNLTGITRSDGHGPTFGYDSLNRLTSVTEPVDAATNIATSYGYDARGEQTRMTDGRLNQWWTTYNSWGLEESRIEPSTPEFPALANRTFTNVYESGGNIVRQDQPGNSIFRSFDNLGRVTAEDGGLAGGDRGFGYDLLGRVSTVSSGSTSIAVGFTDRNQLDTVTGSAGSSSFVYDQVGRMTHRVDSAGDAVYQWTARSQLASGTDPLTGGLRVNTWYPVGTLAGYTVQNGPNTASRSFTWDDADRLTSDVIKNTANQVTRSTGYTYDVNGNRASRSVSPAGLAGAGTDTYADDWSNRLRSWTSPASAVTAYNYDGAGNLVTKGAMTLSYDARNRQLSDGVTSRSWTARGTLASSSVGGLSTNYAFDGLGQMVLAGAVSYTYDGLGRINTRNAVPFSYSGFSNQPSSDGVSTVSRGPSGEIVAQRQGGVSLDVITDAHGDVVGTHDSAGAIIDSLAVDPWGARLTGTGSTDLRWGFQGSYTDPTSQMVDMGARWYDTSSVFVSRDSYSGAVARPVTLNRFAYANNNPTRFFDPDGLASADAVAGNAAVKAAAKAKAAAEEAARQDGARAAALREANARAAAAAAAAQDAARAAALREANARAAAALAITQAAAQDAARATALREGAARASAAVPTPPISKPTSPPGPTIVTADAAEHRAASASGPIAGGGGGSGSWGDGPDIDRDSGLTLDDLKFDLNGFFDDIVAHSGDWANPGGGQCAGGQAGAVWMVVLEVCTVFLTNEFAIIGSAGGGAGVNLSGTVGGGGFTTNAQKSTQLEGPAVCGLGTAAAVVGGQVSVCAGLKPSGDPTGIFTVGASAVVGAGGGGGAYISTTAVYFNDSGGLYARVGDIFSAMSPPGSAEPIGVCQDGQIDPVNRDAMGFLTVSTC